MQLHQNHLTGLVFECQPVNPLDATYKRQILEGLFRMLPTGSIIQTVLYADNNVESTIDQLLPLTGVSAFADYLQQKEREYFKSQILFDKYPVRNFRLFIGIWPGTERLVNPDDIKVVLNASGLHVCAENAQPWTNDFFEGQNTRCFSVKAWPSPDSYVPTNPNDLACALSSVSGGISGILSDSDQVLSPFVFSNTMFIEGAAQDFPTKGEINTKIRSCIHLWALDNTALCMKRLWEMNGFILQEEKSACSGAWSRNILPSCGVAPQIQFANKFLRKIGMFDKATWIKDNPMSSITMTHFHTPSSASVSAHMLIYGDTTLALSNSTKGMVLLGRKGQIASFNLFGDMSVWPSVMITGSAGSGKSFLLLRMLFDSVSRGHGFKFLGCCYSAYGIDKKFDIPVQFINFDASKPFSINPFSSVRGTDSDTLASDLQHIVNFIAVLCNLNQAQYLSLIDQSVKAVWESQGHLANIATFCGYLKNNFSEGPNSEMAADIVARLDALINNESIATWLMGTSEIPTLNKYCIIDLEGLIPFGDNPLKTAIYMHMMHVITQSCAGRPHQNTDIVVLEEIWQWMGNLSPASDRVIGVQVEELLRSAKKHFYGVVVDTPSPLDLKYMGRAGKIIAYNTCYRFFMYSHSYEQASQEIPEALGDLASNKTKLKILNSVGSRVPHYREAYIHNPCGVDHLGRLFVSPEMLNNISFAYDTQEKINQLVAEGATRQEALEFLFSEKSLKGAS